MPFLPVIQPRSCGSCSACCELVGVSEIGKPPGVRCAEQHHAGGCQIYDDRPESCRSYRCVWHYGAGLEESDRPDILGVMLDAARVEGNDKISKTLVAWEVEPGGFERARARLAFLIAKMGRQILVRRGSEYFVFDGFELEKPNFPVEIES